MSYTRSFRGNCSECGFRHELLKDGITVAQHKVYSGSEGRVCPGSHKPHKYAAAYAAAREAWAAHKAGSSDR